MKVKCKFCDYHKETPLDLAVLKKYAKAEEIGCFEDVILFMRKLLEPTIKDYESVKIHMGIKHPKDVHYLISPDYEVTKEEEDVLNRRVK